MKFFKYAVIFTSLFLSNQLFAHGNYKHRPTGEAFQCIKDNFNKVDSIKNFFSIVNNCAHEYTEEEKQEINNEAKQGK